MLSVISFFCGSVVAKNFSCIFEKNFFIMYRDSKYIRNEGKFRGFYIGNMPCLHRFTRYFRSFTQNPSSKLYPLPYPILPLYSLLFTLFSLLFTLYSFLFFHFPFSIYHFTFFIFHSPDALSENIELTPPKNINHSHKFSSNRASPIINLTN